MLRHRYRRSQLTKNNLSAGMFSPNGLHIFRYTVLRNFNVIWFILLACNTLTGRMHVPNQKSVAFFIVEVAGFCAYRRLNTRSRIHFGQLTNNYCTQRQLINYGYSSNLFILLQRCRFYPITEHLDQRGVIFRPPQQLHLWPSRQTSTLYHMLHVRSL
jgi:hypothetical protein